MDEKSSLTTGKYNIEFSNSGTAIYSFDDLGEKTWVATTSDPDQAMLIVEGLILVEHKRFYHPDTQPTITKENESVVNTPRPPFLKMAS